ncbi:Cys-tRNA(Pro) deacylase [Citricoccus sp. K5]|uniref:Cys-tRNA(Pro) deacylase n=1 Tax=Citricoccus sp. K5 TaxID=2653135 RepID=UPI0012F3DD07|nr:Cys-tRNA(Pro) deacylase [Citricoccus sp. K5]VXB32330.1 Cys-tRNA(Pro)/Cys-tRNA(Cys) deacylase YbaK [Citricoccus sp. K5]
MTRKKPAHSASTPALHALERAGIEHEVLEYEHDERSGLGFGEEAAEKLGLDATVVFKTLMVALPDDSLAAAVVPVAGTLDLRALASALGVKKVTMAEPALAQRRTGYVLGGISPMGQRHQTVVVIDYSALALDHVLVSGGRRGLDVRLAPRDLVTLTQARVAPIAAL